ncbi:hypothetical protein EOL96_05665 [Candidatus Saccharibacteria bacterium]|nr:hypothetical protein [Candidatus Saccharibacteria bacterium]
MEATVKEAAIRQSREKYAKKPEQVDVSKDTATKSKASKKPKKEVSKKSATKEPTHTVIVPPGG